MTTLLFAGLGKGTFLRTSFQHSYLINANSTDLPGTLANTTHEYIQCGFLAFVRLVGVVYFKKHYAAFKYESPCTHLNSFASGVSKEDQHNQVLHLQGQCKTWTLDSGLDRGLDSGFNNRLHIQTGILIFGGQRSRAY